MSLAAVDDWVVMVVYADPAWEQTIAEGTQDVMERILSGLCRLGPIGELLDIGCSTGVFLKAAEASGWKVAGFDPNEAAVEPSNTRKALLPTFTGQSGTGYASPDPMLCLTF